MSYEKDQFGGVGGGEGSVSVSAMITAALAPYATSASVATALGAYVTSNSMSAALANYLTSNSASAMITAQLAPYVTSASLTTALGGYVTSNSLSAALAGVGATGGMRLISSVSISIGLGGLFTFSGSWSDYAMLELRATYRPNGTSLTAIAAIYTDGGTVPMLALVPGTVSVSAFYHLKVRAYLGGGFKTLEYEKTETTTRTQGFTATSNTGFVNCFRLLHGTAASNTISVGMVQLYGVLR